MKKWPSIFFDFKNSLQSFYPDCSGCGEPSLEFLCTVCLQDLKFKDVCKFCGLRIAPTMSECLPCSKKCQAWDDLWIGYKYEGGIRDLILDIKNHHKPERWKEFKLKHLEKPPSIDDAVLVAASSDPMNQRKRLFDPTLELAQYLKTIWQLPLAPGLFDRRIFLKSQKELDRETREKFLKRIIGLNSFARTQSYKHLLLVDDIMTTGATLKIHTYLLKKIAKKVSVFCVARSLKNSPAL